MCPLYDYSQINLGESLGAFSISNSYEEICFFFHESDLMRLNANRLAFYEDHQGGFQKIYVASLG